MMDIDSPQREASMVPKAMEEERFLKIHPLTIIGISDHHTRITSGGSAFAPDSIVMGLLFGYPNGNNTISIIDAQEVEFHDSLYSSPSSSLSLDENPKLHNIATKIQLHQTVFPTHQVVGWYRVSNNHTTSNLEMKIDDSSNSNNITEPTKQDFLLHTQWMKRYYNQRPIFLLMNAGDISSSTPQNDLHMEEDTEESNRQVLDDTLPFYMYECSNNHGQNNENLFHKLDFELETFEPEHVAVEEVLRSSQNHVARKIEMSSSSTSSSLNIESLHMTNSSITTAQTATVPTIRRKSGIELSTDALSRFPSSTEIHLQSLISSIDAMNARVAILITFLKKTKSGAIPTDHHLLRQVASLVRQLPVMMGRMQGIQNEVLLNRIENDYDDMLLMTYLASLARTVKTVLYYSDKFAVVYQAPSALDKRKHLK